MKEEQCYFKSIDDLKSCLQKKDEYYELEAVETPVFKKEYYDVEDGFEAILNRGNQKVLIPEAIKYPFLYRGQGADFPLLPSLYRCNADPVKIFIERLRLAEFEILLTSHPVVERFFRRHNFQIDTIGLAQHYGLKTEALDFTNDLDISIFFAVCNYNADLDGYEPYLGDETKTGYIYYLNPSLFTHSWESDEIFGNKISVIGLQPFERPGRQKGFAYLTSLNDNIKVMKYSFSYTKEDSVEYYKRFNNGEKLWSKDILVDKVRPMIRQQNFSFATFNHASNMYMPKGFSKTRLQQSLKDYGIILSNRIENSKFSKDECKDIIKAWNNPKNIENIISKIRRRNWHEKIDNSDRLGPKKLFRTAFIVKAGEHLRLMCNREGLDEMIEEQKKNPPSRPFQISPDAKSIKVPGMMQAVKSESFLTEKDCLII